MLALHSTECLKGDCGTSLVRNLESVGPARTESSCIEFVEGPQPGCSHWPTPELSDWQADVDSEFNFLPNPKHTN